MRIYIKYFFLWCQNIVFTAWAWLSAGRVAKKTLDNWMLPDKYRDYQTPDAFQNGMGFGGLGKGGDRDWYNDHVGQPVDEVSKAWMRRNTAHGYRAWRLGIDYGEVKASYIPSVYYVWKDGLIIATLIRHSGSMTLEDHSGEGHFHYVMYDMADKPVAFMYYRNINFTLPFLGPKRLRLKLGWDLWPMWWPENTPRMFDFSVGIHRQKEASNG